MCTLLYSALTVFLGTFVLRLTWFYLTVAVRQEMEIYLIPFLFMSDQPEVGANLIVPIQTGHVGMIKTTRLGCRIA